MDESMDETQKRLFTLMALAEEQQKSVQLALDGFVNERTALVQTTQALTAAAALVKATAAEIIPAVERAASKAVQQSLAGAAQVAATSIERAARPILAKLDGVTAQAAIAETKLKDAVTWFTWKWASISVVTAGGALVVWWLLAQGLVWWNQRELEQMRGQRVELEREIAQLQHQATAFANQAGRATLSKCDVTNRLCVRIDKRAGAFGDEGDYMILRGY